MLFISLFVKDTNLSFISEIEKDIPPPPPTIVTDTCAVPTSNSDYKITFNIIVFKNMFSVKVTQFAR